VEKTSFIENHDRPYGQLEKCHDGVGILKFRDLLAGAKEKQLVTFVHDDVLPPGASIGDHAHKSDTAFEEWYLCLEGNGIMTLDGKAYDMAPGDITVCRANGSHGIRNTGDTDMRILVIAATSAKDA